MAEILGLGCTHWPTLCGKNETLTGVFKRVLDAPNVDPKVQGPGQLAEGAPGRARQR